MLNALNGSLQAELNRFFNVIDSTAISTSSVSTAAFCKARKKLSHLAFKELNNDLVNCFYESSKLNRWKGFRLLAVDGSVTQLPVSKELLSRYGKARSHAGMPSVRLSQLYDLKNKITIDLQVESHTTGERELALKHLNYAQKGDLIIYDRGYPAVWFYKRHMLRNIDFCMRVTLDSSNIIKEFIESGEDSAIMTFPCIEKSLRRCKKDGIPTASIDLRLVRVELPTGLTEVLITSLMDEIEYPTDLFSDLYRQRWSVEEDYKVMKSRLNIENFSGISVEAVLQDIYAKLLMKNLASVTLYEAHDPTDTSRKNRKYAYKLNFTFAINMLKDNIVRFMMRIATDNLCILLIEKISRETNAYRPNRKFARKDKRTTPNKYPMNYKRMC